MKKFYAFMAASLVAGTAMAVSPKVTQGMKTAAFDYSKAPLVEQAHQNVMTNPDVTYQLKSSKVDVNTDWLVRVALNQRTFVDLVSADYTFEEAPYYWYTMSFSNQTQTPSIAVYDYIIPCLAVLEHDEDESWWVGTGDDQIFDWDKAAQEYGSKEAAMAPAPFSVICEKMSQYYMGVIGYGYLAPYACWSYNTSTWNGTQSYFLRPAVRTSSGWNYDNAGKLYLESADDETGDIKCHFYAPIGTRVQSGSDYVFGQLVGTLEDDVVETTALFTGFGISKMNVGEVHIFNMGAATEDYEFTYNNGTTSKKYSFGNIFDFETGYVPSNMYFVAWCDPALTFEGQYGEASLPNVPKGSSSDITIDQVNWFKATVLLAENDDPANQNPEGTAYLKGYSCDKDGFLTTPVAPGFVFSAYYLRACPDSQPLAGEFGALGQWYEEVTPPYYETDKQGNVTNYTKMGFGDKAAGFNGYLICDNGALVEYTFTDKIYYHYEVDNYVKAVKEIDAVGTADANVTTGVKNIAVSDAETVATQYYNFQGMRLNEAPRHGIYIVREIKADGSVVSKKVAK